MNPFPLRLVFAASMLTALLFALYTNHVWEDYYITYRSSKNLATGHGLVFNEGERLHTFTSPLGVLLPAVASLLTANSSDTGALWIFRTMCAAGLAGAVTLLYRLTRRLAYPAFATGFIALYLATDAKALDFTINGMETAFMLLFLAYAFWAHLTPSPRQALHLGSAWAGLMWTRPDSFIYVALIAAGFWLFNNPPRTGGDRRQQLGLFLRAGLIATVLYGPWLLWAKWYYGTPIPHTIVAKGGQSGGLGAGIRFLENFWQMPWLIWRDRAAAEGAFLPSYYMFPAWPAWMLPLGRALATLCSVLWLVPGLRTETRVASFAFFGGAAYLSYVPYFPFPWYFPSIFLLAVITLGGLLARLGELPWAGFRRAAIATGIVVLAGGLALTVGTARQARAQQQLIEDGNRRVIGEWLKAHAAPGDSVFMEPLGYIGFFSELKTHDWPGMSSRELVQAKPLVGTNWAALIRYLQPEWLVLRPDGEGDLPWISPDLAASSYTLVREFNRLDDVRQLDIPGRKLLEFDARFRLYQRKSALRHDTDGLQIATPYGTGIRNFDGHRMRMVHAPGEMIVTIPPDVRKVSGLLGFPPDASEGDLVTDGATFRIFWSDGTRRIELFSRAIDPVNNAADRGLHAYHIDLPPLRAGRSGYLVFETAPNAGQVQDWRKASSTKDWTCWSAPEFTP